MSRIKIFYICLTIVIFLTMVNPQSPPLLTYDLNYPSKGNISDVALQGIFIGGPGAWKYTSSNNLYTLQATMSNVEDYTITAYKDEKNIYACRFTNWGPNYKIAFNLLGVLVFDFNSKCISIGVYFQAPKSPMKIP